VTASQAQSALGTGGGTEAPFIGKLLRHPAGVFGAVGTLFVLGVGLLAPSLAPSKPFAIEAPPLSAPNSEYLMGTDALGHDLFSQIIHGARSSLLIVAIVAIIVLIMGTTVGLVAGSAKQWIDDVLMRTSEVVQIVPRFFLALVVSSIFGAGLVRLALLLGFTSWPTLARIVRAETQSTIEQEFILAARACGATRRRILWREVLPNVVPTTFAYLGLVVAQALLIEAGIGFLGLGDPNTVSWGQLAGEAQRYLRVAWWLPVFPGACIALTVLSLNLLGDALAEVVARRG
jgi:peptide/nickel transport system permease protein